MDECGLNRLEELRQEVDALKAENSRLRHWLRVIAAKGPASPGDNKHELAQQVLDGKVN